MVRNIVVLGGNSHPKLVESVCEFLGVPPCNRILSKFEVGESRCEIKDSVRGKDVYIIQSFGCGTDGCTVNDHFMDLCIMISACKTGSARRVTAVLPLFPYSRQPDLPYNKSGAPLSKPAAAAADDPRKDYTFESVPATPGPNIPTTAGLANGFDLSRMMSKTGLTNGNGNGNMSPVTNGDSYFGKTPTSAPAPTAPAVGQASIGHRSQGSYTTHDYENHSFVNAFKAKPGYKQWVAQAGTLVADLITCSGVDRVLTCDLHESTYQGFFDIPVDNLYAKPLLKRYIQQNIPNYKEALIVSPDAGGAKRATAIADDLDLDFALIHKERRPTKITERQKPTMILVGNVKDRVCILVDDLADTANTITRAARVLKVHGATKVYALLTHGVLSGDAIPRINASALDKVIVTNTVPQDEHRQLCPKLEVLDFSGRLAEAIRRVHHGESISVLFQYD